MPTKAVLEEQLAEAQRELNRLQTQIDEHQTKLEAIGERAVELADEHGWCGVVTDALQEMEIPIPPREVRVTVTLRANMKGGHTDDLSQYVRESITVEPSAVFDEDFENVRIEFVRAEVME